MNLKLKAIFLMAVFVVVLVVSATSVFGWTPPSQSSDNATDVIVWLGDNITLATDNITVTSLTIEDLEDSLSVISDAQTTSSNNYLALAIIAGLLAFALLHKPPNPVLYGGVGIIALIYGLVTAGTDGASLALWVAGSGVVLLGIFCIYKAVMIGLARGISK